MKAIKIVRVVGGKRHEMELPVGRAREMGIETDAPQTVSVPYLMDGLFVNREEDGNEKACDRCGTTLRDAILRRRVGCSHCYDVFNDTIDRILHVADKGTAHRDRIPERLQRYRKLFVEREELLTRLSRAVEEEDFETAAGLRDRIHLLGQDAPTDE
mgnify:CR=1 FL=1